MIRKNIKELLERLGYADQVDEETLEYLQTTILALMETPNVMQNAFTFKTGSVIHQFVLANQQEVQEALEEQTRQGEVGSPPRFKITLQRSCTYLTEERQCKVLKEPCQFIANVIQCSIARESVDAGLKEWI